MKVEAHSLSLFDWKTHLEVRQVVLLCLHIAKFISRAVFQEHKVCQWVAVESFSTIQPTSIVLSKAVFPGWLILFCLVSPALYKTIYLGKSQRNTLKSSWLSACKYSLVIPWVLRRAGESTWGSFGCVWLKGPACPWDAACRVMLSAMGLCGWWFPGCQEWAGNPGSDGVNTDQAGFSSPAPGCARKLVMHLFFIHTARQVSKYTHRAQ